MKRTNGLCFGLLAAASGLSLPAAHAAEFVPLVNNTSPEPLYALAVSPDGEAVAFEGAGTAWRWFLDEPSPLALQHPASWPTVRDISPAGEIVGYAPDPDNAYYYEGIRWTTDGSAQVLPLPPYAQEATAHALSDDGSVIVGSVNDGYDWQAVRWTSNGVEPLPMPPGTTQGRAVDVSTDGLVIVGDADFNGNYDATAFRWTAAGGAELLHPEGEFVDTYATAVSADGSVVVGTAFDGNGTQAFRWDAANSVQLLGDFPGGYVNSYPRGVSADGAVVVGAGDADGDMRALVWTEATGVMPMADWLMIEHGVDTQGWTLHEATDISADGGVIVGIGEDPNGNIGSWMARVDSTEGPAEPDGDGDGMPDGWELQYGLDPWWPEDAHHDIDMDGLTNLQEFEAGTDPHNPDSDGDGIPDGDEVPPGGFFDSDGDGISDDWEMQYGLDPAWPGDAAQDTDLDGLSHLEEFEAGTDPHNPDSDGDGILDGDELPPGAVDTDGDGMPDDWELQYGFDPYYPDGENDNDNDMLPNVEEFRAGTDPAKRDTDGDGIADGDEAMTGLDPLDEDSDGDGMPDGWEFEKTFDPMDPSDGTADADGDYLTNADEFNRGTDPHNFDTDGDWIPDDVEVNYIGTDPVNPDTDDDGMPDGWEDMNQLDPLDPADAEQDPDADGLVNIVEYDAGTDPHLADSDGDGITDGDEAAGGMSPLRADTDQDGLADADEMATGLDPVSFDTDADGVMDGLQFGNIVRASVGGNMNEGVQGAGGHVSLSADGRFVVFQSESDNLVANDTNGVQDIFIRDVQAGTVERISIGTGGIQADGASWIARHNAVSGDGRYVVFRSNATNLVAGLAYQIYLHDRFTGETTVLAPENDTGSNSNPVISTDGRYVAFESDAIQVTGRAGIGYSDIMWLDRATGELRVVTETTDHARPNGYTNYASISGDGSTVAYSSVADNLVPGDANGVADVFVRNIGSPAAMRVSINGSIEGDKPSSYGASLSHDGTIAVFTSGATNLVPNDTNGYPDVFVFDAMGGFVERVSVSSDGIEGIGASHSPSVSADGRFVAFTSAAGNFLGGTDRYTGHTWLRDQFSGGLALMDVANTTETGNDSASTTAISADGAYVAFVSAARNLVPGDANYEEDVFVRKTMN